LSEPYSRHHVLENGADLLLAEEARLAVDLRELGLAVGPQVLVAEALGDLVVAVEARHHQELLEQLRRLRQREEHAVVHAAGHQVVARALRRALGEHRRLDVDEALAVEVLAHLQRSLVTQHQVLLHLRAAQVEHPVRQARDLGQVLVVELERRRHARVEDLQPLAQHLDLPADEVGVGRTLGPRTHQAADLDAELVADLLGGAEHLGPVGVTHHLHQTLAVAQVDENDTAVVAAAVDPAEQGHGLADELAVHQAGIFGTHGNPWSVARCARGVAFGGQDARSMRSRAGAGARRRAGPSGFDAAGARAGDAAPARSAPRKAGESSAPSRGET